jgi:hypothetical protein
MDGYLAANPVKTPTAFVFVRCQGRFVLMDHQIRFFPKVFWHLHRNYPSALSLPANDFWLWLADLRLSPYAFLARRGRNAGSASPILNLVYLPSRALHFLCPTTLAFFVRLSLYFLRLKALALFLSLPICFLCLTTVAFFLRLPL